MEKGYTQKYDIDYEETFSLVAKMNIVQILLYLVVHSSLELWQFDVKNDFLHGDLEKNVYMKIPSDFGQKVEPTMCVNWKRPYMN